MTTNLTASAPKLNYKVIFELILDIKGISREFLRKFSITK